MSRRPLLSGEEPGTEIGAVEWDGETLTLEGAAAGVFENLRDFMGDKSLGTNLIADGWSNGYLWLGDVADADPTVDDNAVPVEVTSGGQSTAGG